MPQNALYNHVPFHLKNLIDLKKNLMDVTLPDVSGEKHESEKPVLGPSGSDGISLSAF